MPVGRIKVPKYVQVKTAESDSLYLCNQSKQVEI